MSYAMEEAREKEHNVGDILWSVYTKSDEFA